jgi:hypothetical protein
MSGITRLRPTVGKGRLDSAGKESENTLVNANGFRFELCNILTLSCLLIGARLTFRALGFEIDCLIVEALVCATTYAQAQKLEYETPIMHKICPERWFVSYSVDIPPSSPSLKRTRERKRNFLRG